MTRIVSQQKCGVASRFQWNRFVKTSGNFQPQMKRRLNTEKTANGSLSPGGEGRDEGERLTNFFVRHRSCVIRQWMRRTFLQFPENCVADALRVSAQKVKYAAQK